MMLEILWEVGTIVLVNYMLFEPSQVSTNTDTILITAMTVPFCL